MAVLLWLPAILFGAVLLIVGGVSAAVEFAAWRRVRRIARRRAGRRGFRPVVIQGGRRDASGEAGRVNTLFKGAKTSP